MKNKNIETIRGIRNNNPLNICHSASRWQGMRMEQTDKEFVQFESMAMGYRAAWRVLETYWGHFEKEKKPYTVVYCSLTVKNFLEIFGRNVDIGEHFLVGPPAEAGAGLLPVCFGLLHLALDPTLFKMQVIAEAVPADDYIKKFGCKLAFKIAADNLHLFFFTKQKANRHWETLFGAVCPLVGQGAVCCRAKHIFCVLFCNFVL